jgi:HD-like signal output (HDOD) protein
MKKILFVDDEPNVLEGLRRMLHPMRGEWEMVFAGSGQEALDILGKGAFDVVVSDMRMPGMDGGELLTQIKNRYPHMVRIVLSGYAQQEMVLRSIGPTHQYLAKPCDAQTLKATVARACALRELLRDESLEALVSKMQSLPSLPSLYLEIVEQLRKPDTSVQTIGQIVAKDLGMTAKILQLVNSAFFGLRRHVASPVQAVALLGLDTIKGLVLTVHVFSEFDAARVPGFSLKRLWDHSVATSGLAKQIAAAQQVKKEVADFALMGGALHDAGKIVLAQNLPERYGEVVALSQAKALQPCQGEYEVFGTTHAEVGAYLLGLWGLPDPIVEAIAFHHCPQNCPTDVFTAVTAVHVANVLEHQQRPTEDAVRGAGVDVDYLSGLGLADRLPAWQELSRAAVPEGAAT